MLGRGYLSGMVTAFAAGAPGAVFLGYQVQRGRPRRVGANTCFFHGKKLLLGDAVLERVQPPGAGEHRGGATCVDVVHNAVEEFRGGGAGAQQRCKFLELLLYLCHEFGNGGSGFLDEGGKQDVVLALS
jgi:hypothetical protein